MVDSAYLQDQETATEELDEAISLCDFPVNDEENDQMFEDSSKRHDTESSSSPFFEFFSDISSDQMSHAEEIISCGKLLPYKIQPVSVVEDAQTVPTRTSGKIGTIHRRSLTWSLNDHEIVRSSGASTPLFQSGRILGFRPFRPSKPRWYIFLFGLVKFPPEMDLQDMKNRQARLNVGGAVPPIDAGGRAPVSRRDRRNSWAHVLLRVLSCKNHANVSVKASIGFVPRRL